MATQCKDLYVALSIWDSPLHMVVGGAHSSIDIPKDETFFKWIKYPYIYYINVLK